MTFKSNHAASSDLIIAERDILARVALGGPLKDVLRDIILLVEKPANGELLASILLTTEDGKNLVEGAAPTLPAEYNAAVDGIPVGNGVGSCGTAAFTGEQVMAVDIATDPRWVDYKDIALKHNLRACWSMPIRSAEGRILGTFANYYHEPREPTARDLEVIGMVTRTTAIAIERYRNELARDRAEEQRILLINELNHRVKNVFALADAMLAMSAKTASSAEQFATAVRGRLRALSRAHDLVRPKATPTGDGTEQPAISLKQILMDILAPYGNEAFPEKIAIIGADDVKIPTANITAIALILHELATNAAKYGSLSVDDGRLIVVCTRDKDLRITWSERGGPGGSAPVQSGFGSTLVKRTVGSLRGKLSYDWSSEGLDILIELPLSFLSVPA
ncbi:GAF domain-containing protein [Rhizobium sp. 2MFCol3.1]|uniref:sensor histidine kinase n=1 Tax=Rhizobium sp. 2MFCol3.1 TaxID=1246459 RepID=UPI0018C93C24|nr:GAF domain-containing protein [Rhizobium sp. 2MFCol3.1]